MDNKNFLSVKLYPKYYKPITMENLIHCSETLHFQKLRWDRKELIQSLVKTNEIDRCFLVDKGHPAGLEIHVVTKKGLIYILNNRKYKNGENALVTILLARPKQVKRLYKEVGLTPSQEILKYCRFYIQNKYNEC